ncbi:MAG: TonB C-terminal domain-containing protein [Cyanobacteria bacterium SZAS LIN-3]|nr:TonB C-terminal domain-containing protein [Cyanobacteria bacterium SZAS LIN-3]
MKKGQRLTFSTGYMVLALVLALPAVAQDPQSLFGPGPKQGHAPARPPASTPAKPAAKAAAPATPARPVSTMRSAGNVARPRRPQPRPSGGMAPSASPAAVNSYCNRLWMKIQNNWDLANGRNHVVLGVDVDSAGNVFSTQVSSQPKNAEAESKVQQALSKSQPLEALPSGLPSAHLTITFDSTSDPHGESSSGGKVSLRYDPNAQTSASQASATDSSSASEPEKPAAAPASTPPAAGGAAGGDPFSGSGTPAE